MTNPNYEQEMHLVRSFYDRRKEFRPSDVAIDRRILEQMVTAGLLGCKYDAAPANDAVIFYWI